MSSRHPIDLTSDDCITSNITVLEDDTDSDIEMIATEITGPATLHSHTDLRPAPSNFTVQRLSNQLRVYGRQVELPWLVEETCFIPSKQLRLEANDVVELEGRPIGSGGRVVQDFLHIERILRNCATDEVRLHGHLFRRNKFFNGFVPLKMNEVCLVGLLEEEGSLSTLLGGLVEVSAIHALKKRKLLVTNQKPDKLSFRDRNSVDYIYFHSEHHSTQQKKHVLDNGVLVCRWVFESNHINLNNCRPSPIRSGKIRQVSSAECEKFNSSGATVSISVDALLSEWLGYLPEPGDITFLDACCGAGGASVGARLAGLKVTLAVDCDPKAARTYQLNHPGVNIEVCMIDQFIALVRSLPRPTVMHISFPCQTLSRCHTRPGKNDEMNEATLCSCMALIQAVKPRVVTLEQVDNIFHRDSGIWFSSLVGAFTDLGYSLRWKVVNMVEHGVPQFRKRLILIGACPGQALPGFPAPTRGPASRRGQPFVTVRQNLATLRAHPNVANHDIAATMRTRPRLWVRPRLQARPRRRASLDRPLRNIVMCHGSDSSHPTRGDKFTICELARLQTFPIDYKFGSGRGRGACLKQIGNATPPEFMRQLFLEVGRVVKSDDEERERRLRCISAENVVITID